MTWVSLLLALGNGFCLWLALHYRSRLSKLEGEDEMNLTMWAAEKERLTRSITALQKELNETHDLLASIPVDRLNEYVMRELSQASGHADMPGSEGTTSSGS